MTGKVSFDKEDEEAEQGRPVVPPANFNTTPTVKYVKPARKFTRGIASTSVSPEDNVNSRLDILAIQDRPISVPSPDPMTEAKTMGNSEDADENEEDFDRRMRIQMEKARKERASRAQETLLQDYVSLEDETHAHLDAEDINTIIWSAAGKKQHKARQTWEDPDDVQVQNDDKRDSDSEEDDGPVVVDDEDHPEVDTYAPSDNSRIIMSREAILGNKNQGKMTMEMEKAALSESDEESISWELQQIRKGTATGFHQSRETKQTTRQLESHSATLAFKSDQRKAIRVLSLDQIEAEIENIIVINEQHLSQKHSHLIQAQLHSEEIQLKFLNEGSAAEKLKKSIAFHAEMLKYFESFAQMMDEIVPRLEEAEKEKIEMACHQKHQLESLQCTVFGEDVLSEIHAYTAPQDIHDLLSPWQDSVFDNLGRWRTDYPKQYDDCFVHLSIPQIFEIFVRESLLHYDLFSTEYDSKCKFIKFLQSIPGDLSVKLLNNTVSSRLLAYLSVAYSPLSPVSERIIDLLRVLQELHISPIALQALKECLHRSFLEAVPTSLLSAVITFRNGRLLSEHIDLSPSLLQRQLLSSVSIDDAQVRGLLSSHPTLEEEIKRLINVWPLD